MKNKRNKFWYKYLSFVCIRCFNVFANFFNKILNTIYSYLKLRVCVVIVVAFQLFWLWKKNNTENYLSFLLFHINVDQITWVKCFMNNNFLHGFKWIYYICIHADWCILFAYNAVLFTQNEYQQQHKTKYKEH